MLPDPRGAGFQHHLKLDQAGLGLAARVGEGKRLSARANWRRSEKMG